jgi:predicted SnoaL-like aldol condensation-catalyzing enzyme
MTYTAVEQRNLDLVLEMYRALFTSFDVSQVDRYLAPDYKQHSALAEDGVQGLKNLMTRMKAEHPQLTAEVKRSFADGDYVILHVHARLSPTDRGAAVVDIYRLENGAIVEHWDVLQPIPETLAHNNGLF